MNTRQKKKHIFHTSFRLNKQPELKSNSMSIIRVFTRIEVNGLFSDYKELVYGTSLRNQKRAFHNRFNHIRMRPDKIYDELFKRRMRIYTMQIIKQHMGG